MNCKEGTKYMITQMVDLLSAINDESYRAKLPIFKGSSIGQHFRHISDFYSCLSQGLKNGLIDYSSRERNVLIETETEFAKIVFQNFLSDIDCLDESKMIRVMAEFTDEINVERTAVKSSVGRELMYAYDHAVHHLAMIKMGLLVAFPEITIDENIGVAPSTLKHWKTQETT